MLHITYEHHGSNHKEAFLDLLGEAIRLGNKVMVITGDDADSSDVKKEFAMELPLGIKVQGVHTFVQERWLEYGDSRRIVSSDLRNALIVSLLSAQGAGAHGPLPYQENLQFVNEMSNLIACCAGIPHASQRMHACIQGTQGSPQQKGAGGIQGETVSVLLARLCIDYQELLREMGYIEENEALGLLDALLPKHMTVALDGVSYLSPQLETFCVARAQNHEMIVNIPPRDWEDRHGLLGRTLLSLKDHAKRMAVTVDEEAACAPRQVGDGKELPTLATSIYQGVNGLEATGALTLGCAGGHHAEAPLVAYMVETAAADDAFCETTLVFPTGCDLQGLLAELDVRGISYEGSRTVSFVETVFGAFVVDLLTLCSTNPSPETLSDLCLNPFADIDPHSAWRFDMAHRSRRGETPREGLDDLTHLGGSLRNIVESMLRLQKISDALQDGGNSSLEEFRRAADEFSSFLQRTMIRVIAKSRSAISAVDEVETHASFNVLNRYLTNCTTAGIVVSRAILSSLPVTIHYAHEVADLIQNGHVTIVSQLQNVNDKLDKLIIAGMSAATMPLYRDVSPLQTFAEGIGVSLGVEYGAWQRDVFARALSCARQAIMLERVVCNGEGVSEEASGLWEEVLSLYRSDREQGSFDSSDIPGELKPHAMRLDEDEIDRVYRTGSAKRRRLRGKVREGAERAPQVLDRGRLSGRGARGGREVAKPEYSITEIETYRDCHYRWFLSRKLNSDTIDQGYGVRERGIYIHRVLECFYEKVKEDNDDTPIHISHVDGQRVLICLEGANAKVLEEGKGMVPLNELEQQEYQGLKRTLERFVESDRTFLPGFLPSWFELRFGMDHGRPVKYAGVWVKGSIDRVDVDPWGRFVVVDYKSPSMKGHCEYGFQKTVSIRTMSKIQVAAYASIAQRLLSTEGDTFVPVGSVYRSLQDGSVRGLCDRRFFETKRGDALSLGDAERLPREPSGDEEGPVTGPDGCVEEGEARREGVDEAAADHALLYDGFLERLEGQLTLDIEQLQGGDIAPTRRDDATRDPGCAYCPARSTCKEVRP